MALEISSNFARSLTRDTKVSAVEVIATVLIGLLFLVATVRFGAAPAADQLDPSWALVLTWAKLRGLHWGSDIAFTYGPLGYLYSMSTPDPAHYGVFVAQQIALAGAAAFLFANAWFAQRWTERIVLALAIVLAAPVLTADAVWLSMPVLALVGMYAHANAGRQRALWLLLIVAALYAAIELLIKMSTLPLIASWWLAAALVLISARKLRHAVAWLFLVPAASLALWLANDQRLADLLPFMGAVLEISRGYTAAMGASPPWYFDLYGIALFGCCGIVILWAAWQARGDLARFTCIAFLGLTLFVAWRAGFTRADTHVAIFVVTAWLALPLLPALPPAATPRLSKPSLILALGLIMALLPIAHRSFHPGFTPAALIRASFGTIQNNAYLLLHPFTYQSAIATALEQETARLDLPQTRTTVGASSVDLVGTQQGVAIINGFSYRPAPVFQGYGAYTPSLQRLNAAAYSGPERTDFVLLAYSPIDGNFPASENALAFTTLYRNYHPVLVEKSYLLLQKDATFVPPQSPPESGWQQTTWDEWIDLPTTPDTVTILAARTDLSLLGEAAAILLREPTQRIELQLSDGTTQSFRLTRLAAPGGFMVSPPVQSLDDYVRLFSGDELPVARRFRLIRPSVSLRSLFAHDIQWTSMQIPRRPRIDPAPALLSALYPGFSHPPQARSEGVRSMEVEGHRVLFMHSPAQLTFRPGVGSYVISGEIGIVPNAYTSAGCEHGDGVELQVGVGNGVMHRYAYNPFADAALRSERHFEFGPMQTAMDGTVILTMSPGPANNSDCDWSYVRDVKLRPVATE